MKKLLFLLLTGVSTHVAAQQLSEEEMQKANNPLANAKALNFQNYYVPNIYENADLKANTFLVRFAVPLANGKILTRFTMPVNTVPTGTDASGVKYASGLGDLNFFATYTFSKPTSKLLIGAGPQVSIPTANNYYTGTGKWQLGGALIIFSTASPVLQLGSLITYQASIAGQEDRSNVSSLQMQPFVMLQLGKGTYLRSTALWNFNLETDAYNIPLGVGVGQVVKAGKTVFNLFLEPQFTVAHYGTGQSAIQLFSGINLQF
ncbi:hypothetical protein [Chitinophaga sp. sic0106]|uniref:hypothetical protein n=1 Tax=Chitinophaga sp. sic0106 TaxID=2854785 RepID=UPI001C44DBB2|nr:hypothetical protein [Chitinophaga sp. sic0106]MBV7530798.1 hypothetical protein [Chitinophaga sp. sic0106]